MSNDISSELSRIARQLRGLGALIANGEIALSEDEADGVGAIVVEIGTRVADLVEEQISSRSEHDSP